MKRRGHSHAYVPALQAVQLNRQSPQFDGLVSAWLYNSSRYQSVVRDVALFNDATLNGAYAWQETDNPLGSGVYGAGGNSGGTKVYADAGNDASLQVKATGLTICIWTRLYQSMGGGDFPGLIGKGDADSNTQGSYLLYLTANKLNYLDWSGNARKDVLTGVTVLDFQASYLFVATWQPSTRASIFVNGLRDATTTTSVPATLDNPNYNFLIGTNQGGGTLDKYSHRGVIHEARLYQRALSEDEVWQLWNPPTRWELYQAPIRIFGYANIAEVIPPMAALTGSDMKSGKDPSLAMGGGPTLVAVDNLTLTAVVTGAGDATAANQQTQISAEQAIKAQTDKLTFTGTRLQVDTVLDASEIAIGQVNILDTTDTEINPAKEDGNLAAILLDTADIETSVASLDSKAPALGQALAAGSVPIVLTAAQVTTLTPPAAITGFALEAGNLASIVAVEGTTAGAAVITDANGTIQQYLRGIVAKLVAAFLAANTARTTATLVLPTQPIDAAGNVMGRTAANTARTTATLVDPIQIIGADGAVFPAVPVLGAGAAIIGQVGINQTTPGTTNRVQAGGTTVDVDANFTRPADTTAYAANDSVTNSTSAPTVITFTGMARSSGGSGVILDAVLIDESNPGTTGSFDLYLFDTTFTPTNDNAVIALASSVYRTFVGKISFATVAAGGANGQQYHVTAAALAFVTVGSANLFGCLVARNAYTPASAGRFDIRLKVLQD